MASSSFIGRGERKILLSLDESDDGDGFPAHLTLVVVGADLHDLAVFGALDDLVVVECVLLVGDNQDHRVGVVDGASVLHFLLGLGKSGIFEDNLQNLEDFGFRERNGSVKHSGTIRQFCLLFRFRITFPGFLCCVGFDCEEGKRKKYASYDAKKK